MARQRQRQVFGLDPVAIVLDTDQGFAAVRHGDVDPARARVNGVLDQFLDGRGRPLHDLSGCDAIHRRVVKLANSCGFLAYIGVGGVHTTKTSMAIAPPSMPPRQVSVDKKSPVPNLRTA